MPDNIKIISWNINSIRSRIELFKTLLKNEDPDVVLLQETKVMDDMFPFCEFEETSYNIEVHGQKAYNGVAVFSKSAIEVLKKGFDVDFGKYSQEARLLYTSTFGIDIASLYAPNGQEVDALQYVYKLAFYDELIKFLEMKRDANVVLGGDFNIAFEDIDIYNPKAWEGKNVCSAPERDRINLIKSHLNFHDTWRESNVQEREYTWWDYRFQGFQKNYGLRIDYLMLSDALSKKVVSSNILKQYRSYEKPSDHAPIEVVITL